MVSCLIVDDNAGFLVAAARLLQGQGMVVTGTATTGAEALRLLGQLLPDVVLTDIDLGQESGLELAERLDRAAPAAVILISTHCEQDYRDLIAASPAVGFLPKSDLSAGAIERLLAGFADAG
ncbi:response regulator transcription factor [Kribbella sp. CA-253562]|uniref:response regulator transcription factor n=1 Tax=Kribbella sp. CA-253562 TaxID=3239942 RepID=UPI003D8A5828